MKRFAWIPLLLPALAVCQVVAIRAERVYPVSGPMIANGVVLVCDGKIEAVGPAAEVRIPEGADVLTCKVATPGLVDVRASVGLSGMLNVQGHDQDQIERSSAMQPELRAEDAYNPSEPLIRYLRSLGVTTVHSGHIPGMLISGQTAVFKTSDGTAREVLVKAGTAISATLGPDALGSPNPGTRAKQMALLRQTLTDVGDAKPGGPANLRNEALARVLAGEVPLLVTAHKAQDILLALRLGEEFGIRIWLDGASEAYLVLNEIKAAKVPVLLHPTMFRPDGDARELRLDTAKVLHEAGIPFAIQSGFEGYVPKTRVVLFEAAMAAANGLPFDAALRSITLGAAEILGLSDRIGSLQSGRDADIAMFDGDPFEYQTRCVGVLIGGKPYPGEGS